ncbi:MAG TPA: GNAT family N-acetyltransferase [Firmicutes bacterium]|nr:GNAT family N-acetyltransferase [Bacillota bacterium]
MDKYQFEQAIRAVYRQNPCQVLPNAIWKTIERLPDLQCSCRAENGAIADLRAWDSEGLYVFWNKHRTIDEGFRRIAATCQFIVVHNDHYQQLEAGEYPVRDPFFRLLHDLETIPPPKLPPGFSFREANPEGECIQISELISRCYRDLHPSPEIVRSWTRHHAYHPTLWIWIRDDGKGVPAALGIAEFDHTVGEGSLEWIQTLPEYHGQGLGTALVLELLRRLQDRAEFVTVSGEVNNPSNPQRLYRKCGFAGSDVWWLLRR